MANETVHYSTRRLFLVLLIVIILAFSTWYGSAYYLKELYSPGQVHNNSNGNTTIGTGSPHSGSTNASGANPTSPLLNVLLNYGNGTSTWFNATRSKSGWNFYNMTVSLANGDVDATYYPSFNEHFVNSINGVVSRDPFYWLIWIYCGKDRAWMSSVWGADLIKPSNEGLKIEQASGNLFIPSDTLAWYYQNTSGAWAPPVSGAKEIPLCSP